MRKQGHTPGSITDLNDMTLAKPFPKRQILDPSKLKEFSDENSKFDEKGKKLSKRVGNTVGKREIAHYEQFLLFPVFSKDLYCRQVKTRGCLGKG